MDTVNTNPPILLIPVGTGIMGTEIGKQKKRVLRDEYGNRT